VKARFRSRRDLAIGAAALLLPIPLLAASGLMVPVPSAVERALVSLLPGGGTETERDGDTASPNANRPGTSAQASGSAGNGNEQDSAGVLSEGGNATAPAEDGAAGSDDSSADNVLPGDERLLPGGGESDLPVAPDTPGGPTDTGNDGTGTAPGGGGTSPAPGGDDDEDVSARLSVGPRGVEVDASRAAAGVTGSAEVNVDTSEQNGITLTVDADIDDTSGDLTVTLPVSLPALP
jgi:hypothetical protein